MPAGQFLYDAAWTITWADETAQRMLKSSLVGVRRVGAVERALPLAQDPTPPEKFPCSLCRNLRLGDGTSRTFLVHYERARAGQVRVSLEPVEWSVGFMDQFPASGIGLTDERGIVVHHNPSMSRMLGVPPATLTGLALPSVVHLLGATGTHVAGALESALVGQFRTALLHYTPDDGRSRTLDFFIAPWRHHGRICGTIWLGFDVTESGQLRDSAVVAASLHTVATLHHELRNPLQTMEAAAAVIRPALSAPHQVHALEILQQQIQAMAQILENRLRGPELVALAPGRVSDVVAGEIERARLRVGTDRLSVVHRRLPEEPLVRLQVSALSQVFANLLRNAGAARPDATVRIGYAYDGETLECRVADNGPGFPAAMVATELGSDPWDHPLKHLGLKIVASLVRAHGGELRLSNGAQGGARVAIRLPVLGLDETTGVAAANQRALAPRRIFTVPEPEPQGAEDSAAS